jgi:hypothetical protein
MRGLTEEKNVNPGTEAGASVPHVLQSGFVKRTLVNWFRQTCSNIEQRMIDNPPRASILVLAEKIKGRSESLSFRGWSGSLLTQGSSFE